MKKSLLSLLIAGIAGITAHASIDTSKCTTTPEAGKYYRIVCPYFSTNQPNVDKAMFVEFNNNNITKATFKWGNFAENNASFIWTFTPNNNGTYSMRSLSTGQFPANTNNSNSITLTSSSSPVTITAQQTSPQVSIKIGSNPPFHCFGHSNGNGQNGNICTWGSNDLSNTASGWVIEEMTEADVLAAITAQSSSLVYDTAKPEDYATVMADNTKTLAEKVAYFTNLQDQYYSSLPTLPENGKYYTIKTQAGKYWTNTGVNNGGSIKLVEVQEGAPISDYIYEYDSNNYLRHVATDTYFNGDYQKQDLPYSRATATFGIMNYGMYVYTSKYAHNSGTIVNRCSNPHDPDSDNINHAWTITEVALADVLKAYIAQNENATNPLGKINPEIISEATTLLENNPTDEQLSAEIAKFKTGRYNRVTPSAGMFITFEASPLSGGNANSQRIYFYSTNRTTTGNIITTFNKNDYDADKAIWYYTGSNLINYSTGMYLKSSVADSGKGFIYCVDDASANSGCSVLFESGCNESGTLQMNYNGNRGLHSGWSNNNLQGNACGAGNNEIAHNLIVKQVTELPVAIHADGKGTGYIPVVVKIADADADDFEAYKASTDDNNDLVFTKIETGGEIPANTPFVIKKVSETTKTKCTMAIVENPTETAVALEMPNERFIASHIATTAPADDEEKVVYVKSATSTDELNAEHGVVFDKATSGQTIPAGTLAFYAVKNTTDVPETFTLKLSESNSATTAISEIGVETPAAQGAIYDLQGRRLSAPAKGINIINGRKVLVK